VLLGKALPLRPFLRPSGLQSDHGNALSEEPGFAPGMAEAPPVATDILLQFSPAADSAQVKAALQAVNGQQAELVRAGDAEAGPLLRVELPEGQELQGAVEILSQQPGVVFAEANEFVNIASGDAADVSGMAEDATADDIQIEAVSNDPGYLNGSLWNMEGDQTAIKNEYGSQAGEAWAAGYTGNMKTVVGIVDTGIDYTHIDLYLNIWLNQSEIPVSFKAQLKDIDADGLITFRDLNNAANSAFVTDKNGNGRIDAGDLLKDTRWANGNDQDGNGYKDDLIGWDFANNDNDPFDDNMHGTHVAGTIGAQGGNGVGVAGVNWNLQIIATKFLSASGSGSTANAVKAIDYFTDASKLAPASENFVATNNSWGGGGASQALQDAITRAAKADILFMAAAGNNGTNNDTTANYPSNYDTKAAAGYDNVIAVASITSTGALSSFSDYGKTQVDLGAPGSAIYSTLPGDKYGTLSGTSMATPLVTGAAALYASTHPNATAAEIKAAILGSVDATVSLSGLVATNGRLDVSNLMAGNAAPPVVAPSEIVIITAVLDNMGGVGGIVQAGGITGDTTPTLLGTLSAPLSAGESLVVYHNGVKAGLAAVSGTNWSFTEASNLVAAAWSFTARVENTAGAAGSYSAAYGITIAEETMSVQTSGYTTTIIPSLYSGPVSWIKYQILGSIAGDVIVGTSSNDFINLADGDDAANASAGDDVLDGGTGSNFLSGGIGRDDFFLDGRGGTTTWTTITDWEANERLSVWGWRPGVSKVKWVDSAGAPGWTGITMHGDLDGNGVIDTSVTWTGLTRSQLPTSLEFDGLLWFT